MSRTTEICATKRKKQSTHVGRNGPLWWRDKAAASLGDGPGPLTACGRLVFWCCDFSPSRPVIRPAPQQQEAEMGPPDRPVRPVPKRGPVMSRAGCIVTPSPDGVASRPCKLAQLTSRNREVPICRFMGRVVPSAARLNARRASFKCFSRSASSHACCTCSRAATEAAFPRKSPEPDQKWGEAAVKSKLCNRLNYHCALVDLPSS